MEPDGLCLLSAAMYTIFKALQRKGRETNFIREQKKVYFFINENIPTTTNLQEFKIRR